MPLNSLLRNLYIPVPLKLHQFQDQQFLFGQGTKKKYIFRHLLNLLHLETSSALRRYVTRHSISQMSY